MPTPSETRVLRIDISGHDHPGVTPSLTAILARNSVRILDIGQALIHDALALGMLVELGLDGILYLLGVRDREAI